MRNLSRILRLLPLLWRLTGNNYPPRSEWFKGFSRDDLLWLAGQQAMVDGIEENAGSHMIYEARRELKRRDSLFPQPTETV